MQAQGKRKGLTGRGLRRMPGRQYPALLKYEHRREKDLSLAGGSPLVARDNPTPAVTGHGTSPDVFALHTWRVNLFNASYAERIRKTRKLCVPSVCFTNCSSIPRAGRNGSCDREPKLRIRHLSGEVRWPSDDPYNERTIRSSGFGTRRRSSFGLLLCAGPSRCRDRGPSGSGE